MKEYYKLTIEEKLPNGIYLLWSQKMLSAVSMRSDTYASLESRGLCY